MILYDDNVSFTDITTIIHSGVEFITTFFNNNTHDALYLIAEYKPPKMQLSCFNSMLETFIHKMPSNCPIVIIGDFNINLLTNIIQLATLQTFMKKYNFKPTFFESTTISDTQIDHIWTNAPTQQCYSRSTQAYWTHHKPIYLAFKLPNYVLRFILPK